MFRIAQKFLLQYIKQLSVALQNIELRELFYSVLFFILMTFYNQLMFQLLSHFVLISGQLYIDLSCEEVFGDRTVETCFQIYEWGFLIITFFMFAYLFKNFYLNLTNINPKYGHKSYILLLFLLKIINLFNELVYYIHLDDIFLNFIICIFTFFDFLVNKIYLVVVTDQITNINFFVDFYYLFFIIFFILNIFFFKKLKQQFFEFYEILPILINILYESFFFNLLFAKKIISDSSDEESKKKPINSKQIFDNDSESVDNDSEASGVKDAYSESKSEEKVDISVPKNEKGEPQPSFDPFKYFKKLVKFLRDIRAFRAQNFNNELDHATHDLRNSNSEVKQEGFLEEKLENSPNQQKKDISEKMEEEEPSKNLSGSSIIDRLAGINDAEPDNLEINSQNNVMEEESVDKPTVELVREFVEKAKQNAEESKMQLAECERELDESSEVGTPILKKFIKRANRLISLRLLDGIARLEQLFKNFGITSSNDKETMDFLDAEKQNIKTKEKNDNSSDDSDDDNSGISGGEGE
jgi:hypothetical protein